MSRVFNAPIIANDSSIDRLFEACQHVIILFWNGRALSESVNKKLVELAEGEAGHLIVAKVNVHENPESRNRFSMAQTPALLLIRDSQEIARVKSPTPTDIQDYVLYLLGRGPKPVRAETQPADRSVDSSPIAVTDKTFTQVVLESPVPVLVDFWAPWCGPCQIVAPILEKLSGEFAGKLRVAKVNVDENPHYAGVYGIQGIPTLLLVRDGQIVDRFVGAMPEHYLRAKLTHYL